jgi:general secretion pathway protein M
MMDTAKNWFWALTRREQILLGIAAGLLLFIIVVFGIVRPLWVGSFAAERSYQDSAYKAAQLDARYAILQSAPQRAPSPAGNLVQILATDASQRGITLDSNSASGADGALVAIEGVNPNSFLQWSLALEAQGIILTQLSMRPLSPTPSIAGNVSNSVQNVSVRAVFSRAANN